MPAQIPFQLVCEACQKTGASVILIGGQALGARGYQRMTLDLDFMVTEQDYEKLKPAVVERGYREFVRTDVTAKMRAASDELIDIDFVFVDPATFSGVQRESREENFGDCKLWVPKAEHLIAMKLHAVKQQPQLREFKDLNDIVELIKANRIDAKSGAFKSLCLKFGTEPLYKKILGTVETYG